MPVHFNSFIEKEETGNILSSSIFSKNLETADEVFCSKDKKMFHLTKHIFDQKINEKIGKIVITLAIKRKENKLLDIDITLLNDKEIELNFLEKLDMSSEANEYYEVSTIDDERHFQIETVNRYSLAKKKIENTKQKVYLSCFPFILNIFNNMEELNEKYGFSEPIRVGNTDMKVTGFDKNMVAVGGMLTGNFDEPSSFIIGRVDSFKDITAIIGELPITFTIIKINTAFGIVPVAASRKIFDLKNLSVGKTICMVTDVKADFQT